MSAETDTNSVVIKTAGGVGLVREELLGLAPRLGRDLGEDLLDAVFVDLLEGVGAIVRRHLRDELGGLARRDRLEELGSQLLVEILENVRGASGTEGGEERLQLPGLEQLCDSGEVGRVHFFRLDRDIGRRLIEQRDDIGREQGRDRAVLRISLRWSHWALVITCTRGVNLPRPSAPGQPSRERKPDKILTRSSPQILAPPNHFERCTVSGFGPRDGTSLRPCRTPSAPVDNRSAHPPTRCLSLSAACSPRRFSRRRSRLPNPSTPPRALRSQSFPARRVSATVAVASRALKAPVIDGKADDAVWATAQVIDGFRTFDPTENGDPRFRTEARVAYDARNLYVLVRAFDPHPDSIVALLSRRDVRTQSEWLKLIIDGYHDRRTGVELSVNPVGVKRDFAILNDGEEDESWDGVWDVGTRVDSLGWVAEFRVPLNQLRYAGGERHTFGFGIWRDVARYNERYSWPMYSRSKNGLVVAAR